MSGNVELPADLGVGKLLFGNKLDGFSLKLGSEGTTGNSFHGYA